MTESQIPINDMVKRLVKIMDTEVGPYVHVGYLEDVMRKFVRTYPHNVSYTMAVHVLDKIQEELK